MINFCNLKLFLISPSFHLSLILFPLTLIPSALGIPRPVPEYTTEVEAILSVPSVAAVMPPYDHETEWTQQVRTSTSYSDLFLPLFYPD